MNRTERDTEIGRIPWVTRVHETDLPCEGIKWGQVSLKHLYSRGDRPAEGIPDRARCKLRAQWKFRALAASTREPNGRSGQYCIHHLVQQISDHPREASRYQKWKQARQTEVTS